jgi:hypothetical protein
MIKTSSHIRAHPEEERLPQGNQADGGHEIPAQRQKGKDARIKYDFSPVTPTHQ